MVIKFFFFLFGVDILGFEDFGCLDFDFFRRFRVFLFFLILWLLDLFDFVREFVYK